MGDIAFNIEKNVDLNKVVNLEIDKDVDVNVDNPDQLATAEADAEAFGEDALAETDAFTYVNGEPGPGGMMAQGLIDVLGNTSNFVVSGSPDGTEDVVDTGDVVDTPNSITVNFTCFGGILV